jgi:hypothetical protein
MRKLSTSFLECLKGGFLSGVVEFVRSDHDLNLEIREGYFNIYFKGNSLLKLCDTASSGSFRAEIHEKFTTGLVVPTNLTAITTSQFIKSIPLIKENINRFGKHSLELEYEQMLIRANNYESRNNTEYFIVDRQYVCEEGRFDLTGMYWNRNGRRKNQEVPVCLMELKFALNTDIREVHHQLARYYESIKNKAVEIAVELETVFKQKLELNLYDQPANRLEAMKTLAFSRNINKFQFILILVDYNRNSTLLNMDGINQLPFGNQVRVFTTGFGMWHDNVKAITNLSEI